MKGSERVHDDEHRAAGECGLADWTGSHDAMRFVGERLGVFGQGRIEPGFVLSKDNRLHRALFDVLLNLVEGGVADIRDTARGYEFRTRNDDEVSWLAPVGPTIDLVAEVSLTAELRQACLDRDAALHRAAVAEALAMERERVLMMLTSTMDARVSPQHESEPSNTALAIRSGIEHHVDKPAPDEDEVSTVTSSVARRNDVDSRARSVG